MRPCADAINARLTALSVLKIKTRFYSGPVKVNHQWSGFTGSVSGLPARNIEHGAQRGRLLNRGNSPECPVGAKQL